jgi:hypothetical protein
MLLPAQQLPLGPLWEHIRNMWMNNCTLTREKGCFSTLHTPYYRYFQI